MRLWAVDVGGSHIGCALVEHGRILARGAVRIADTSSFLRLLPGIAARLRDLGEADGLCVSFPALVNHAANRVTSTPAGKYEDAAGFDLPGWARAELGCEVRLELDSRMTLLGEGHVGAVRGARNAAMLAIGTGLGTAAMVDGHLLRGASGSAGALAGHLSTSATGERCICGNRGCLEAYASTWALPRLLAADPDGAHSPLANTRLDFAAVFGAAENDDLAAIRLRDHCVATWAAGVVNLIHAYDPEVVLLAGGVMVAAAHIVPVVEAHVAAHAWTAGAKPRIVAAALGSDAPLLAAEPLWAMT